MSNHQPFRQLASLLILHMAILASPALACKNDTSANRAEEEFRSRYESLQPDTPVPSRFSIWGIGALSVGSGLIAGSVAIGLQRKRRGGR